MKLCIEYLGAQTEHPLAQEPVVIGRGKDCDLRLEDPELRRHCQITVQDDGYLIEDLGSKAGTLLGGAPLAGPTRLQPGDCVEIGRTRLRLLAPDAEAPAPVLGGNEQRDARNVRLLLETIDDLYGSDELSELLSTVVDRAIVLVGGDRGALLLKGSGGRLESGVARDASGRDLTPEHELSRSLPRRALELGRTVVLTDSDDPGQEDGVTPSILKGGLRSVLCAPLPGPDGQAGVLYVDSRRPAESFGPSDLGIFEALATHGALAIERARLQEERERRDSTRRERLESENRRLKSQIQSNAPIGESPAMRRALDMLRRVAGSEATVCLLGDTGTGKEVLARYLHACSPRARGPFVVVDCGALPENLIESELFGHEKGAFTGAATARPGRFREAEGGTLLLDEIGELPAPLQSRLLRVLQERTVQPVGGSGRTRVDVRIVAATHRDLDKLVEEGGFRQDLYYRLAVIAVEVPSLSARQGDILLLARHFLHRFAIERGAEFSGFTREACEALLGHAWPGNVRELEHRVQRAVLLADPPFLTSSDLGLGQGLGPEAPAESELPTLPLTEARARANERFERAYLCEVLEKSQGRVADAAELAGVSRQLLQRLVRRHGIDRKRFA